jgi:hypothetical protein
MPGAKTRYKAGWSKGKRGTVFRYVSIREPDYWNLHV